MLYFKSDYTGGAHPKILEALERTNLVSQPGYGEDCFSAAAAIFLTFLPSSASSCFTRAFFDRCLSDSKLAPTSAVLGRDARSSAAFLTSSIRSPPARVFVQMPCAPPPVVITAIMASTYSDNC